MAAGAACAVSCRSGMLAKSSCSATPMARARTTIFPSLAPAETNDRKQVRDGKRDREDQRERTREESRHGGGRGAEGTEDDRGHFSYRQETRAQGRILGWIPTLKGQITNKAALLLTGAAAVDIIQTTTNERKRC